MFVRTKKPSTNGLILCLPRCKGIVAESFLRVPKSLRLSLSAVFYLANDTALNCSWPEFLCGFSKTPVTFRNPDFVGICRASQDAFTVRRVTVTNRLCWCFHSTALWQEQQFLLHAFRKWCEVFHRALYDPVRHGLFGDIYTISLPLARPCAV